VNLTISSKICFVVLTTLMIVGFSDFVTPEAYGFDAADTTVTRTSSTTIVVDSSDTNCSIPAGLFTADWVLSSPSISVTNVVITTAATCIITLTTADDGDTSSTPTLTYNEEGGSNLATTEDVNVADDTSLGTTVDDAPPTVVSAAVTSSTTIDFVFSEGIDDATDAAGDFTVTNPTTTISSTSVSGSTVTLTLATFLTASDTPTVTVSGSLDDAAAPTNPITSGSVVASVTFSNGGGSGCDDCEAPTLGLNSGFTRMVENGFTYNGKATDAERYFTPYPLITVTVGKQNTAVFKIYEDRGPENIKHFSFAFGLDKGEIIGESKAMVELDIDHEGTETVTVTDPENVLDKIKVFTNIANCNENDSSTQCLIVTINHTFRSPLDFNIVGTDVWDMNRNSWQNYFNHGIEVTGESLNPASEGSGIYEGHIYHLTETSNTTAVDEFGDAWSFKYGLWMKDYVRNVAPDTKSIDDRMHSGFASYKELQAELAIPQLLEYCPSCLTAHEDFKNSFGHSYPDEINKLNDPEILQKMVSENEKAQLVMNYLLDPTFHLKK
jgi:hypothetical protein